MTLANTAAEDSSTDAAEGDHPTRDRAVIGIGFASAAVTAQIEAATAAILTTTEKVET